MAHRDEFTKPILPGKGATDYERYLRTDELLALQKPAEELLHKDEMTFLVVHQSSKLLMKGAAFELGRPLAPAFRGELGGAGLTAGELYRRYEEFFGLHDVAERMLDFDERMQLFRFHHLKLAERVIGGRVVGTMGTPVEVLQQRMESWLYKDLWDVRNQITAANPAPAGKQYQG